MTLEDFGKLQSFINSLLDETLADSADKAGAICRFCEELITAKGMRKRKLLIVEDGSIDYDKEIEELNEMGFKVLVYRQGANKPEIISKGDNE